MKKEDVKKDVTERIKTFEDAQRETGRLDVPDFSNIPEDLRSYFEAQYKAIVITEALNEGSKMDWSNGSQKKWLPWFYMSSSGFAFYAAIYGYSYASAGDASRLCFKSSELATYAGRQFTDIYSSLLLK
jgi:hypothetical protein